MDSPGPDDTRAPKVLIPCGFLAALGLALCITRIYTRYRRSAKLFLDDYLIIVSVLFSLTGYVLFITGSAYGWGHHSYYVPQNRREIAIKLLLGTEVQWFVTISLIRISIATCLLRLSRDLVWRIPLFTIIVVQALIGVGYIVVTFGVCHPLNFYWEPVPNVVCWPYAVGVAWGWSTSGIMIVFDVTLALMPIKLIRTLSRPLPERILISCLMATGLIATAIACVKLTSFWYSTHSYQIPDSLRDTTDTSLYSKVEEQLGIIAACMPCLKRPAEEILRRIGILGEEHWRGLTKPSFLKSFSTREEPQSTPDVSFPVERQMSLQDVGKLIHKESQGSGLGLVRTGSTESSGIPLQTTAGGEIPATYQNGRILHNPRIEDV